MGAEGASRQIEAPVARNGNSGPPMPRAGSATPSASFALCETITSPTMTFHSKRLSAKPAEAAATPSVAGMGARSATIRMGSNLLRTTH